MYRVAILLLGTLLLVQLSCTESTGPTGKDMYISIDVESAFQNDPVRLQLDGTSLLDSTVTTNYTINLAWSSGLRRLEGPMHTLVFGIVGTHLQKSYTFDSSLDTSTVLIRFNRTAGIITIERIKGLLFRD